MTKPPFLSLYIHIPLCRRLCPFCHFYRVLPPEGVAEPYLTALLREAKDRAPAFFGPVRTVYVGGGTPTLLPGSWYARLLEGLGDLMDLASVVEATVEADGEETQDQLRALASAGFDRVSFGVKSFSEASLKALGVCSSRHEGFDPVAAALGADFHTVNVDLVYAFEGQSSEEFAVDLDRAIGLCPDSVSLYPLEAEPDRGPRSVAGDDMAAMYLESRRRLLAAGYGQYEIGNFARTGRASLHNLNYWRDGNYLGLGPSAASSRTDGGIRTRETCAPDLTSYLEGRTSFERVDSAGKDRAAEALMLALRTPEGAAIRDFTLRYGHSPLELMGPHLKMFRKAGLVRLSQDRVRLTPKGMLLSNEIFERIF